MRAWGERWWGLSGIVFVVLFLVGFMLVGDSGETAEETLQFYVDNEARLIVAYVVFLASAVAYVWFAATVRNALARVEPVPGALTALGFGGALVTAAVLVVAAGLLGGLNIAAGDFGVESAEAIAAVNSLAYPLFTGAIALSSLLAFAVGMVTLRTGIFPRWLGWVSLGVAPVILVAVLFIPIFVFLAWVALVGVMLLMTPQSAAARA